jgi:hypothetical protein
LLEGVCVVEADPLVIAEGEVLDPGVFVVDDLGVLFGNDVLDLETTIKSVHCSNSYLGIGRLGGNLLCQCALFVQSPAFAAPAN